MNTKRATRILVRGLSFLRITLLIALTGLLLTLLALHIAQGRLGEASIQELTSRWEERPPTSMPPSPGDVVGWIEIPRIGLSSPIVEMANVDDKENLDKGPAHLAGTAYPGEEGNCVIAGHRTTYTRPFYRIDELTRGDYVILTSIDGSKHVYLVRRKLVVNPDEVWVMDKTTERTLTLIACHPLFSARKRLVIQAIADVRSVSGE